MWEENSSTFLIEDNLSLLKCLSPSATSDMTLSPCKMEPISPSLSSTGNGSPNYASSVCGSMSPDTTYSPGGESGCFTWSTDGEDPLLENDSPLPNGFKQATRLGWSFQPMQQPFQVLGVGGLPPLHEWRKDKMLHHHQQHQPLRFLFPPVESNLMKESESVIRSDVLGNADNLKLENSQSQPECMVTSTSSPIKGKRGKAEHRVKILNGRNGLNLSPYLVGERAEKFMKSFASSSSSSPNTYGFIQSDKGNSITSTSTSGNGEKLHSCFWIDCKLSFMMKESLIEHIDRVHIQTRKEDFSCFWHGCIRRNRPFNARYKLLIHMRVHTGHKPNKCTVLGCDKAFSRLENLKIHLRSHTGERPYICPYCPKAFSNSSDRAKHQRTHFDSKPYACVFPNCEKRYTDPSSLRKHAKMHYIKKVVISKEEKKEIRRNRRKPNNTASTYGTGSKCQQPIIMEANTITTTSPVETQSPTSLSHIAPAERKSEICLSQHFMTGNGDPTFSQFESGCNNDHETVTDLSFPFNASNSTQGSTASLSVEANDSNSSGVGYDLDGILLGDLDWIKGVNLDENFDIDCLI